MAALFRYISALITTKKEGKLIQSQKDSVRLMEQNMIKQYPVPVVGPFADFPNYESILAQYKTNFGLEKRTADSIVVFGDSIANQLRITWGSWLIDPDLNYSYPGMWAHHIAKMIQDMSAVFKEHSFIPKYVLVGTPGGNNLLQRQDFNATILQVDTLFRKARECFPSSKIIFYGLPNSIVAYLILSRTMMNTFVLDKVFKDGNAIFLQLDKGFVDDKHLLPLKDESKDGVHFTPLGILRFCDDIKAAIKKKAPGVVL